MAGIVLARAIDVMDRPWKWGEADCCTAACDVFRALHDIDPMAPLRGRYRTMREAHRIIRDMGGFVAMAKSLAASAGLSAGTGEPGEIGVAEHDGGLALVIAIGPRAWAGKTLTGMTTVHEAVVMWRAP